VVKIGEDVSANDLWVHDETDRVKAGILSRFFDNPKNPNHLPRPFGLFYTENRNCYEDKMMLQINESVAKKGTGNLDALLSGKETWTIN
jgi:2-oxoglutarate ferredoxin oxidoreductase subunit beta